MSEITTTEWHKHIIYDAVVGSRAYGLETPTSDEDRRGVYLPPTRSFWGLTKPPEQINTAGDDATYWEAEKFIKMALQANPTVLEVLWAEDWQAPGGMGSFLRTNRSFFISKRVKKTYLGYATDQMNRFVKRKERGGEPDWKHLMHCCRMLIQGRAVLETGDVPVRVPDEWREKLLSIRRGEWELEDVQMLTTRLEVEMQEIGEHLPDEPNRKGAEGLLRMLREIGLNRT